MTFIGSEKFQIMQSVVNELDWLVQFQSEDERGWVVTGMRQPTSPVSDPGSEPLTALAFRSPAFFIVDRFGFAIAVVAKTKDSS
jgi:hypothetical protein